MHSIIESDKSQNSQIEKYIQLFLKSKLILEMHSTIKFLNAVTL
jgi:hypothetical protein